MAGVLTLSLSAAAASAALDRETIAAIVGVHATMTEDGVVRVGWPRTDVAVLVDGLALRPAMGLGTWAAFQSTGNEARLMGDSVVFEDEVDPAIDAALASGLDVNALHNHFAFDEPKVYFLHIGGSGPPDTLARGVRSIWDAIRRVRAERSAPARIFPGDTPTDGALDTDDLEERIGEKGALVDGVFKITLARQASMGRSLLGGSMGLTTWMAFAGSDAGAAVAGDFAMTRAEVQPVLRALRAGGIHVVALHNHVLGEEPPFYFTHFWGKGPAAALATSLRATLDAQREAGAAATRGTTRHLAIDFEAMELGASPAGFSCRRTGEGDAGAWQVSEDRTPPSGTHVLTQTSADPTSYRFPLCVYDGLKAADVEVSVAFQPLSGEVDQAAGLIWRYRDPGSYYVVRANALEGNVVLYKVDGGKRTDLKPKGAWPFAYGTKAPVPRGRWSVLRVRASGDTFRVWLNNQHLFDVEDPTFSGVGKVGVWTKADSVTAFDDLRIDAF